MTNPKCNLFVGSHLLSQRSLVSAHHFIDLGPVFVKVEGGHGLDPNRGGDVVGVVDVDLDEFDFRIFSSELFKYGSDKFAWTTPESVKRKRRIV